MIRAVIFAFAVASVSLAAAGQPASAPAFEVASIRLHQGRVPAVGIKISGPRVEVSAMSVTNLMMDAYDVKPYQVTGGPSWTGSDRWDITAKSAGDAELTRPQMGQMMQQLLAERFQLTFHRETKESPVYALAVASKGKLKLKENTSDTQFSGRMGGNQLTAAKAEMNWFATQLSFFKGMDVPVIDKTGLTGAYDFKLTWSEQDATEGDWDALLQDQLGLKLVRDKAPIEMLVIDHAEKPSEN